jgi:YD repeat-containing protein
MSSEQAYLQSYSYDHLNRLQSVVEGRYVMGETAPRESIGQGYSYDRWGNRTINNNPLVTFGAGVNSMQFTVDAAHNRLGVPNGQSGTMSYDNAGNLTTDTYSGSAVLRAYDAENRMTSETAANNVVSGSYTYDADGHRVRRNVGGTETWQVYGLGGELIAEYAANASTPQKEYGYRNGQLLITAAASQGGSSGQNTNSLSLNGSGAYMQVAAPANSSLNITGPVTLEAWIKVTASTSDRQSILARFNTWYSGDGGYLLELNAAGKASFSTAHDAANFDTIAGATTVSTGVWHHVAGVFDGSQLAVYLDGVLDGSKASTYAPTSGTTL